MTREQNIYDAVSTQNTKGFADGNTNGDDYVYDANDFRAKKIENLFCEESERSSMIKDRNKGIENISYNHLNLPTEILWSSSKKIQDLYNAAGQKLKKTVRDNDSIKIVEYLDGFQYAGERLQFFLPIAIGTEGYVKVSANQAHTLSMFNYVFNYTDHLGNVRLSYTKDPQTGTLEILDEDHYYPFGLRHGVYVPSNKKEFTLKGEANLPILEQVRKTEYQYKYNSKEWQDELGLDMYDYGARNYDPAIGRWMNMDPLAEKFVPLSPYSYVANNPIIFIDIQGKIIGNPDGADTKRMQAILSKTETGRQVWNSMVKSDRTIYVHYVSANSDNETSRTAQASLKNANSDGRVVSKGMYDSMISEGDSSSESFDKAWSFNENTGEYDKTSDWDETHILINEDGLTLESAILGAIFDNEDLGKDVAEIRIAGEEAYHSIQDYADFKGKEDEASYQDRRHEIEAKETVKQMEKEYLKP